MREAEVWKRKEAEVSRLGLPELPAQHYVEQELHGEDPGEQTEDVVPEGEVTHADVREELVDVAVLAVGLVAGQLGTVVAEDALAGGDEGELEVADLGDHLERRVEVLEGDEEPGEEEDRDGRRGNHEHGVLEHTVKSSTLLYYIVIFYNSLVPVHTKNTYIVKNTYITNI